MVRMMLQPEQIRFYTIKRMGINALTGECSILLGTFVHYLPSIICKVRLVPAGFAASSFSVTFNPLDSYIEIPEDTKSHFKMAVFRIIGPWMDTLQIQPSMGDLP